MGKHILFPRKPVEPVMRMLFPFKYSMIVAPSMLLSTIFFFFLLL
jgi:hypothetical protein